MWERNGSPVNSCVRLTASCLNQNGSSVEMLERKPGKKFTGYWLAVSGDNSMVNGKWLNGK